MYKVDFDNMISLIKKTKTLKVTGKVTKVVGLTVEVEGIKAFVGEVCTIITINDRQIQAEVVGFRDGIAILMPFENTFGIAPGSEVISTGKALTVKVSDSLLGRVLDGLGRDMNGYDFKGAEEYKLDRDPPNPLLRKRIDSIMTTGVRAIDGLLTCGIGQRIGIFAGSGVGKSTLLGMIAKYADADVNVIALIGERGREVKEFIEKDLGPEGLKKSVVVVATSDQSPIMRLKGAYAATSIAEYFRDKGLNVMMMMDSVTRFAMAQREIGLTIGEPPATKGYTPSVFAMLPRLMERTGRSEVGSITAFYTVLVDGDDMNEPIADATRGILDGHIVFSRKIAAKNHYPAIDINSSVSRLMSQIAESDVKAKAGEIRDLLATHKESEDLINIGAYQKGANHKVDKAIDAIDSINDFLKQKVDEYSSLDDTFTKMMSI
ncbi:flagellar protein export ATPase FliI [Clostridium cylindrosporum]|uniref:Flagellum-specific ATP synthase FliI n=1 Tax=Clostridium cylindrosporum DSM 605 TaxID=1121307 RepID=A0A0J8D736_CLOCY|nr:flagellar protein export ATPase FliI [Clostridium cylindrosporum]KMT21702.1 flagellum-specific ATP synthase FliI [Clostridium cylindrosporum DSM 605]